MQWIAGRSHFSFHQLKKTAFMAELADRELFGWRSAASSSQERRYSRLACSSLSNSLSREFSRFISSIKKTAFMAELADRGVVRLAFCRFVVARAAILPSRLLLLVELPFPGVLTFHFTN